MIGRPVLLLLSVVALRAAAQTTAPTSPGLFDAPEWLARTLTTDLKAVIKDRGSDRRGNRS